MNITEEKYKELLARLEDLDAQLQEANDTIQAIKTGQIDALVVTTETGPRLYTLKSADHTYRVFIEKMKEGAVTLNENAIILYSNTQFASMVGLPLTEVIGLSFEQFIPELSKKEYRSLMSQGWKSDTKGETVLKNLHDQTIPVLLSFTSLELDEGTSLSVILTDLSSQKETERQLMNNNQQLEAAKHNATKMNEELEDTVKRRTKDLLVSREHFKFLADNIPVIIWTADTEGKLDYVNRQWSEYTGFDLEESKIKQARVVHPDDFESSSEAWKHAIRHKIKYEQEVRFKRTVDDTYRWHYVQAIPFKDEHGNITAWIGTNIDIEDQKQKLEKKDEFISVASHELRTPLTSLKGYMHLMKYQDHLPEDTKSFIAKANTSVNKLQRLIDELLDASKIKAGKLEFSKNVFDLSQLIHQCIDNSKYMYPAFEIRPEVEENILINGNEERIEQVLMNLINNAVKYSPDKKDMIISAKKEGKTAEVSVIDFGIGMSEPDQKLVFERFYRANGHAVVTPGLGMGLYIASEIIKEHNGHINVSSKINEGSVFSLLLPLAVPAKI